MLWLRGCGLYVAYICVIVALSVLYLIAAMPTLEEP